MFWMFWIGNVLEIVLNKNSVKAFTDGSKINGRVGAGFYVEFPDSSQTEEAIFYLGRHSTVFEAEVFAISMVAEKLFAENMQNENIIILVDSQAAIKALESSIMTSYTVLESIKNLNNLGCQNRILVTWSFRNLRKWGGRHSCENGIYIESARSWTISACSLC